MTVDGEPESVDVSRFTSQVDAFQDAPSAAAALLNINMVVPRTTLVQGMSQAPVRTEPLPEQQRESHRRET
jgi:hypothetical protein